MSEATDKDCGGEASGDPETVEKAGDVSGAIVPPASGPLPLYTETIVKHGLSSLLF